MKKIDYWDLADSERLYYTSINEAVEEILKNLQEEEKETPSVLTLTGFTKMKPDVKNYGDITNYKEKKNLKRLLK